MTDALKEARKGYRLGDYVQVKREYSNDLMRERGMNPVPVGSVGEVIYFEKDGKTLLVDTHGGAYPFPMGKGYVRKLPKDIAESRRKLARFWEKYRRDTPGAMEEAGCMVKR